MTAASTNSNALIQKVLATLTAVAILAGAGALITQAQLETKVDHNAHEIEKSSTAQVKIREDVAVVKTKVAAIEKAVDKNGDKLDKILERLP